MYFETIKPFSVAKSPQQHPSKVESTALNPLPAYNYTVIPLADKGSTTSPSLLQDGSYTPLPGDHTSKFEAQVTSLIKFSNFSPERQKCMMPRQY